MMSRALGLLATVPLVLTLALAPSPAGAGKKGKAAVSEKVLAEHPDLGEMRQRVKESPADAALRNDLGNLYAKKGWDDLAIASYREAIRLDPELYVAWTNLGTLYNKAGELAKAAAAFETAIELQPRGALAHYNLGVVREQLGDYDGAMQSYKTAVTYNPELFDPGVNPQIVNNRHEMVMRLLKYLEEVGASSLPLANSSPEPDAAPNETAEPGGSETGAAEPDHPLPPGDEEPDSGGDSPSSP